MLTVNQIKGKKKKLIRNKNEVREINLFRSCFKLNDQYYHF